MKYLLALCVVVSCFGVFSLRTHKSYPYDFTRSNTPVSTNVTSNCSSCLLSNLTQYYLQFFDNDCPNESVSYDSCCRLYNTRRSGVYNVRNSTVYCDMTTDGGGWMTILYRANINPHNLYEFIKTYEEYQSYGGFGNKEGNHWAGLDYIYHFTKAFSSVLRIDLWDNLNKITTLYYGQFSLDGPSKNYRLNIDLYSGSLPDELSYHNSSEFSTYDRDLTSHQSLDCAEIFLGGWWYKSCWTVSFTVSTTNYWETVVGTRYRLYWGNKTFTGGVAMKIRPKNCFLPV